MMGPSRKAYPRLDHNLLFTVSTHLKRLKMKDANNKSRGVAETQGWVRGGSIIDGDMGSRWQKREVVLGVGGGVGRGDPWKHVEGSM